MTLMIADMFGITGRQSELRALLADAERLATSENGCLRYTVATSLADADHYLVVEEWRDQAALEAHYASESFARFEHALHGLLARPSQATIHSGGAARRPIASGPLDPREAD
jgi:quinol monooxygenase YgiN